MPVKRVISFQSSAIRILGILLLLFTFHLSLITSAYAAAPQILDCKLVANQNKPECIISTVSPPPQIPTTGNGELDISTFLNRIIELIFSVAGVVFVIMILVSAVQWIMSGGQKEAVAAARSRLTWAIIGVVLLSLAFAIIKIIGAITGFTFFT